MWSSTLYMALNGNREETKDVVGKTSILLARYRCYARDEVQRRDRCIKSKSNPGWTSDLNINLQRQWRSFVWNIFSLSGRSILAITDRFSKYAKAISCRKQTANSDFQQGFTKTRNKAFNRISLKNCTNR